MIVKCKYVLFICVDDSTIRESILWLRNNLSPWELVKNHWKVTEAYRRNQIQTSQNKNIAEIFSQWPVLKQPAAHALIDEDFKFLNVTSEDCINNWFKFFSQIQEVCHFKEDNATNELQSIIETDNLTNGKFTKSNNLYEYVFLCARVCTCIVIKLSIFYFYIDAKVITQILLLPHLIPPKGRIRLKQEHYKSSISECKNSIVLHAKVLNVLY